MNCMCYAMCTCLNKYDFWSIIQFLSCASFKVPKPCSSLIHKAHCDSLAWNPPGFMQLREKKLQLTISPKKLRGGKWSWLPLVAKVTLPLPAEAWALWITQNLYCTVQERLLGGPQQYQGSCCKWWWHYTLQYWSLGKVGIITNRYRLFFKNVQQSCAQGRNREREKTVLDRARSALRKTSVWHRLFHP